MFKRLQEAENPYKPKDKSAKPEILEGKTNRNPKKHF